jgi:hypothetical protein
LGGGYIIIQRFEWEKQDNAARKSLIESRLHTLETLISRKATTK